MEKPFKLGWGGGGRGAGVGVEGGVSHRHRLVGQTAIFKSNVTKSGPAGGGGGVGDWIGEDDHCDPPPATIKDEINLRGCRARLGFDREAGG